SLIVSAGAWSNKLLYQLGLELPLNPVRNTFAWFETNESLYNEKDFPAFTFESSDKQYYGFPSINGTGLKLGRHDVGQTIIPEANIYVFVEDEEVDVVLM